jgi:spore germination protein YaaH
LKEKDGILVIMNMNRVKNFLPSVALGLALAFMSMPHHAVAANMQTAAWVPWFGADGSTKSAIKNMDKIDILYLFVYEANSDGSIKNRIELTDKNWSSLINSARSHKTKVIPTIAWFDGDSIAEVLSDPAQRAAHEDVIVQMVKDNNFDGVNIDYEQKNKETKDNFSLFLKELNDKLADKVLTCALEARTPADSLYKTIPANLEYANDYKAINKYCDWVEIMAYDQQRADLKLNEARKGVPYMPVADKDWVKKVVELAIKDIDADKILLGVPTYGRAWDVSVAPEWYRDYASVASLNHTRVVVLSKKYKSKIGRTDGGEAVISYIPDDSPFKKLLNRAKVPKGTPKGFEAAAKALQYATDKDTEVQVRFVTWSDASAIKDKFDLIDKYHLKGTAIFKVDGQEDPKIWKLIK